MIPNYLVHDQMYKEARAKGWSGWGGDERMAQEHILINRLFSYDRVPASGKLLELGCGEGHYARRLAATGYQVTGVDISATAVQWAKEKTQRTDLEIRYLELDLTTPALLLEESFDLIVDGHCLHCIIGVDRVTFIGNVFQWLKQDGLFFVSTLCREKEGYQVVEYEGKPYRFVPSKQYLHRELEEAGFRIRKSVYHRGKKKGLGHCTVHVTK